MEPNKPWYASSGVWGGLIAELAGSLAIFNGAWNIDMEAQGWIADALASFGAAVGGIVAVYGRVMATKTIGSKKP